MILGFDIDGVMAEEDYKKPYGKPQYIWNNHYEKVKKISGSELLNQLIRDHKVILITGRIEGSRKITINWLDKNNIRYTKLHLRKKLSVGITHHKITEIIKEDCDCYFDNNRRIIKGIKAKIPDFPAYHFKSWREVYSTLEEIIRF